MWMCFNLTLVDDSIVEADEIVVVSLTSSDLTVSNNQLNVTIQDNDGKIYSCLQQKYSIGGTPYKWNLRYKRSFQ